MEPIRELDCKVRLTWIRDLTPGWSFTNQFKNTGNQEAQMKWRKVWNIPYGPRGLSLLWLGRVFEGNFASLSSEPSFNFHHHLELDSSLESPYTAICLNFYCVLTIIVLSLFTSLPLSPKDKIISYSLCYLQCLKTKVLCGCLWDEWISCKTWRDRYRTVFAKTIPSCRMKKTFIKTVKQLTSRYKSQGGQKYNFHIYTLPKKKAFYFIPPKLYSFQCI